VNAEFQLHADVLARGTCNTMAVCVCFNELHTVPQWH
jgi:hypothetical protein